MINVRWEDELRYFDLQFNANLEPYRFIEVAAEPALFEVLLNEFLKLANAEEGELRWVLSKQLTLYFKRKTEGDSRALLAHPEENEWVGTVLLNETHLSTLLENLQKLTAETAFELGDFLPLGRSSNLNIKFCARPVA